LNCKVFKAAFNEQGSLLSVYGTDSPYFGNAVRVRSGTESKTAKCPYILQKPVVRTKCPYNHNFCKSIKKSYEIYDSNFKNIRKAFKNFACGANSTKFREKNEHHIYKQFCAKVVLYYLMKYIIK
jgi:hypothetical protein